MNIKDYFCLNSDLNIENIMVDSRLKLDNSIFFCIVGLTSDGHSFINKAIENGAICIVCSKKVNEVDGITYIYVDDTRDELNKFANVFYGRPSENMKIYAVTGTNGKTTSSYITYDILNRLNNKAGYIGTLGYAYDEQMFDQFFTTPNINDLHKMLKEMHDHNCRNACIEVSSQGLDLHRTDSVDFDVATYTNLTHDHLDYHKNYENYFNAKARLFENLKSSAVAIINIDDPYGKKMIERCSCDKTVTYAIDKEADYSASNIKYHVNYSEFTLSIYGKQYAITTNMIAKFNIYNLLGVIASLVETGYSIEDIIPLLKDIADVPGRCMHIKQGQDFNVLVDYAHTPDGFIKILDYAKAITPDNARILVVFGLRGSGDTDKRPECGKIVDEYCDEIYLTCDDNHFEDINQILDGIQAGIKNHNVHRFELRDQAIEAAIKDCKSNDTLCILSKGIERFYKVNDSKIPYEGDDRVATRVLNSLKI